MPGVGGATAYLGGATAYLAGGATAYLGGATAYLVGLTMIIRLVSVQVKLYLNCQLELSLAIRFLAFFYGFLMM